MCVCVCRTCRAGSPSYFFLFLFLLPIGRNNALLLLLLLLLPLFSVRLPVDPLTRSTNSTSLFVHYVLNFHADVSYECVCVYLRICTSHTQTHRSRVLGSIVRARRFPFTPVLGTSKRRRRRHFDSGGGDTRGRGDRDTLQTYFVVTV